MIGCFLGRGGMGGNVPLMNGGLREGRGGDGGRCVGNGKFSSIVLSSILFSTVLSFCGMTSSSSSWFLNDFKNSSQSTKTFLFGGDMVTGYGPVREWLTGIICFDDFRLNLGWLLKCSGYTEGARILTRGCSSGKVRERFFNERFGNGGGFSMSSFISMVTLSRFCRRLHNDVFL